jgi:hypothetical protein
MYLVICPIIVIILIILCIVMIFVYINKKSVIIENYYDLVPYEYTWDISSCYDVDCIKDTTKKCYDWCDTWNEPAGRTECRMNCLDGADQMLLNVKFNDYTFSKLLPKFKKVSLLTGDNNEYDRV